MTEDDPERGLYFFSALESFQSRTAYANTAHDHLVGWTNSSLRFAHELPVLPDAGSKRGKGVVLEDDIWTAFHRSHHHHQDQGEPLDGSLLALESATCSQEGEVVSAMLKRLQRLPWRRIDVSFKGSAFSLMAHNHIQVI